MKAKTKNNTAQLTELIALIVHAKDIAQTLRERYFKQYGLSPIHFRVLVLLSLSDSNGMTLTELSKNLGVTKPNMTTLVSRMEQRGYIRRVENANDKRSVNVTMTDQTSEMIRQIMPKSTKFQNGLLDVLSKDDLEALHRITLKVIKWMDDKIASTNNSQKEVETK